MWSQQVRNFRTALGIRSMVIFDYRSVDTPHINIQ